MDCEVRSRKFFSVVMIILLWPDGVLSQFSGPSDGICVGDNVEFTCVVSGAVTHWRVNPGGDAPECTYFISTKAKDKCGPDDRFQSSQTNGGPTNSSTLRVASITSDLNETTVNCSDGSSVPPIFIGSYDICITGPASPPTHLSVVYDSSQVVVSFQSPVYGGQCVEHYIVSAISDERNISCDATSDKYMFTCSIPPDSEMNKYNFTVSSVTDGTTHNGGATTCNIPFPENVKVDEKECGVQHLYISWESSHITPNSTIISWQSVNSNGIHNEDASSEGGHLLVLNYSDTGPLKVSVTFSDAACDKTTVIDIDVKGVLTSVSLESTELTITSRDCLASPLDYSIVVTIVTDTGLKETVNISFSTTVQYSLDEELPSSLIRVEIVYIPSNTTIDEWETEITYTPPTPSRDPSVTIATIDNGAVQPTTADGDDTSIIAAGVGGAGGLLVVALVVGILIAGLVLRKRKDTSTYSGDELKILGTRSQASIEDRRYEPPSTAAPAEPQRENTAPDVVPASGPLYADLNTLTMKKEVAQSTDPPPQPVYHVLEGPTPVPPDWENRTKPTEEDARKDR